MEHGTKARLILHIRGVLEAAKGLSGFAESIRLNV